MNHDKLSNQRITKAELAIRSRPLQLAWLDTPLRRTRFWLLRLCVGLSYVTPEQNSSEVWWNLLTTWETLHMLIVWPCVTFKVNFCGKCRLNPLWTICKYHYCHVTSKPPMCLHLFDYFFFFYKTPTFYDVSFLDIGLSLSGFIAKSLWIEKLRRWRDLLWSIAHEKEMEKKTEVLGRSGFIKSWGGCGQNKRGWCVCLKTRGGEG